jgi:hypothetical protein
MGGDEKVVQTPLDAGAEVNAQGGRNGSAPQAVSVRGDEKVVRILLGAGDWRGGESRHESTDESRSVSALE